MSTPSQFSAPAGALPIGSLLRAVRRLMRPMVRLLLKSGITFPVLADTMRRLFVDVAVNDLLADAAVRTDSRVSLLTGIHRKEIKRLREEEPDVAGGEPETVTLASAIIARWLGMSPFASADGKPLPLDRAATAGRPSFETLVTSVTHDIRPRTVLDSLLSHGVVYQDVDDRIHLNVTAFLPRAGGEEQLFYFARNLHDHIAAAALNLTAAAPPFLDRSVHYDCLTEMQAVALEQYARQVAMDALLAVNRRALELCEAAPDAGMASTRRVNLGIYLFNEGEAGAEGGAS